MARTGGDGGSRKRSISVSGKGSARASKKPAPKYQNRLTVDRAVGNATRNNRGASRDAKRDVNGWTGRIAKGDFKKGGYRSSGAVSPSASKSPRVLHKRPRKLG